MLILAQEFNNIQRTEPWTEAALRRTLGLGTLRDARLAGFNLKGARLEKADLRGADLSGADLRRVKFAGARLERADLCRAQLEGAGIEGARLPRAILEEARLEKTCLSHADFSYANLRNSGLLGTLWGTDFTGADLSNAVMRLRGVHETRKWGNTIVDGMVLVRKGKKDGKEYDLLSLEESAHIMDRRLKEVFPGWFPPPAPPLYHPRGAAYTVRR